MRCFALCSGLVLALVSNVSFAHGGKDHGGGKQVAAQDEASSVKQDPHLEELYGDINSAYETEIKPIFVEKCFDCHSDQNRYPWYYVIPGIKQLIDHDIEEGREHLDLSAGFPFKGHATPIDDLQEIKEVIEEDSMPPFIYRLGHWGSGLTEEEKVKVLAWVEDSLRRLNAPRPE